MQKTADSATQRAYDYIRERLQNHDLQPGARLVTRNLAKELGTSLNPVREALNRLSSQGLVEHVPGAGTFVHRLDAQRIRDLYGARTAIETHAAAEAARQISTDDIETLRQICAEWSELAERMRAGGHTVLPANEEESWAQSHDTFHRTLVEASGNAVLAGMVTEKRDLTNMFESLHPRAVPVTVHTVEQAVRNHSVLIDALARRDADAASRQTARMLESGRDDFLEHLENPD